MPKKTVAELEAENEALRRENELKALEIAYLKNLRALVASEGRPQGRDARPSSKPKKNTKKPN
jgi:cell division protein FtsB